MTNLEYDGKGDVKEIQTDNPRRIFIKAAAAAGLLGAVGVRPTIAQPTALLPQASTIEVEDPQAPPGMKPGAALDPRFRVTYEKSLPAAVGVLTQHFASLSERNLGGVAQTMHFPFASYEGINLVVIQSPEELIAHAPPSLNMSQAPVRYTDHEGYLKPGAYDVLEGIEVINFDPVRVNLAMTYNRYAKEGNRILRCEGVYCVTNNDGKWAIQLMSTIFTPSDVVGVVYHDTIEAAKRCRINHTTSYLDNDYGLEDFAMQTASGKRASITGGGYTTMQNGATEGDPMAIFRVKGVKTRLNISERTAQSSRPTPQAPKYAEPVALYHNVGHGIEWGFPLANLQATRVLHATMDKAHLYSGAARYTPAGEEINTSMDVNIVTFKHGHWGMDGTLAYTTTHDRVNDL